MLNACILIQITDAAGNVGWQHYQDVTDTLPNIIALIQSLNSGSSVYIAQCYDAICCSFTILA
jgi:hypothetical protein